MGRHYPLPKYFFPDFGTRLRVPTDPVELDRSNPYSEGLVCAFIGGVYKNFVTGAKARPADAGLATGIAPDSVGRIGLGIQLSAGATNGLEYLDCHEKLFSGSGSWSGFFICTQIGGWNSNDDLLSAVSDGTNGIYDWRNTTRGMIVRRGGVDSSGIATVPGATASGDLVTAAFSHDGANGVRHYFGSDSQPHKFKTGAALGGTFSESETRFLNRASASFNGWPHKLHILLLWSGRAITDENILDLHRNPFQLFRPIIPPSFYLPSGAAVNLVIADAAHAHAADNLALTQLHQLIAADAAHAHSADALVLTQQHQLAIAEALHAHTADNLTLSTTLELAIAGALHTHAADNLALTQVHVLTVAEATHGHTADNVTLSLETILAPADGAHGHTADVLALTQTHILAIAGALHAHAADNIALTQAHILAINDALHAQLADGVTLVDATILPDGVVFTVAFEGRTLIIAAENRTLRIISGR